MLINIIRDTLIKKWRGGFTPSLQFRQPQLVSSDSGEHIVFELSASSAALSGRQKNQSKFSAGFTLIETVVAFAVIMAALIGPVSLITKGIIDITFSRNRLIALNLAQEGIELVRLARDNNVFCDYLDGGIEGSIDWNHDPGAGFGNKLDAQPTEGTPDDREADAFDVIADTCGASTLISADFGNYISSNPQKLRIDASGLYQYSVGTETPFDRRISIDTRMVGGRPDIMEVTSVVTWSERGRTRTVTLQDKLYNWR